MLKHLEWIIRFHCSFCLGKIILEAFLIEQLFFGFEKVHIFQKALKVVFINNSLVACFVSWLECARCENR